MYKDAASEKLRLAKETERFYAKVNSSRKIDNEFAIVPEGCVDEPLTEEEKAQVKEFWGRYSFAYPEIDYKSFQTFKNRLGRFSPYHIPGAIRTEYLAPKFLDDNYRYPFQHKAMLQYLYSEIPQPVNILRQMDGILLDQNYSPLTLDEAVEHVVSYASRPGVSGVIFKRNMSSGGRGVQVLKGVVTPEEVRKIIVSMGNVAFVVQECIKQSPFMNRFNESSVNTIRITTMIWKKRSIVLAALIRIGGPGSAVDNWCSGGMLLGIDKDTGKCNDWAMLNNHAKSTILPSGVDLTKEEFVVPNFDLVKKMVTSAHYKIPYVRMISWDIALDQDNTPTLIETNFWGMIQIHEAVNGPLFGDLTKEILDEYLLNSFYNKFATDNFICKEFHDHVTIIEYIGKSSEVVIPRVIRNKPVTLVEYKTFVGCKIDKFTATPKIIRDSIGAMQSIKGAKIIRY